MSYLNPEDMDSQGDLKDPPIDIPDYMCPSCYKDLIRSTNDIYYCPTCSPHKYYTKVWRIPKPKVLKKQDQSKKDE